MVLAPALDNADSHSVAFHSVASRNVVGFRAVFRVYNLHAADCHADSHREFF